MNDTLVYPARLDQRDGGVLVTFPDFDDARTFGLDESRALDAAPDCLRTALAVRIRNAEGIPAPSPASAGTHLIAVPADLAAKLAVISAFDRAKISKVQFAARLDVDESEIRRILDPSRRTKLDRLEKAARVLGVRLQIVAASL